MTIYDLKPAFQSLLRPLVRALAGAGVTANIVTRLAAVLSVALGIALALNPDNRGLWAVLPAFLFVRMALNAIDGMLAREFGQRSPRGAIINEGGDVVSDAALYLPFALLPGVAPWLVVVAVLLAWLTEFAGVLAQTVGASRRYDGPLGKSDRAFVFGLLALLLALGVPLAPYWNAIFAVIAGLLFLTVWNRVARGLKEARGEAPG